MPPRNWTRPGVAGAMQRDCDLGRGIYIISTDDGFPCKVGVTNDLRGRVSGLQCGNWERLQARWFSFVLGKHWRGRKTNAWAAFSNACVGLEKDVLETMHDLDLHLSGEWFNIDVDDCIAVIGKVADEKGYTLCGIEVLEGLEHFGVMSARSLRYIKDMIAAEQSAREAIYGGEG